MQVGFPLYSSLPQGHVLEGCLGTFTPTLVVRSGAQRNELLFWMKSSGAAWVGGCGGRACFDKQGCEALSSSRKTFLACRWSPGKGHSPWRGMSRQPRAGDAH